VESFLKGLGLVSLGFAIGALAAARSGYPRVWRLATAPTAPGGTPGPTN
jgi:hypothetical protein